MSSSEQDRHQMNSSTTTDFKYENKEYEYDDDDEEEREDSKDKRAKTGQDSLSVGQSSSSGSSLDSVRDIDDTNIHIPTVYVHGLSLHTREDDLEKLFSQHGTVKQVKVVRDPRTKINRGFAFVTMGDGKEAQRVIDACHSVVLCNSKISVQMANRKEPRQPTPGKYLGPKKPVPRIPPPHLYAPYGYAPPTRRGYIPSRFTPYNHHTYHAPQQHGRPSRGDPYRGYSTHYGYSHMNDRYGHHGSYNSSSASYYDQSNSRYPSDPHQHHHHHHDQSYNRPPTD